MQLDGYLEISIDSLSKTEFLRVYGSDFSWVERGRMGSLLFIYFDEFDRFRIYIEFSIWNHRVFNWQVHFDSSYNYSLGIMRDGIIVPSQFLDCDPCNF